MTKKLRTSAALLATCLLVTSCSGDDSEGADARDTPTVTATTGTPSPSVTPPPGVTLTEPGSEVSFGEAATVAYSPNQSEGTILELTVDDAVRGRISDLRGFNLDTPYKRNANYYFVRVSVENVGDGDLGGRDVPLNGVNEKDTLLPPVVFQSAFQKCPTKRLPKTFRQGDSFKTCLVFLAPDKGELKAVSYRPEEASEPITWTGEVQEPKRVQQKKG